MPSNNPPPMHVSRFLLLFRRFSSPGITMMGFLVMLGLIFCVTSVWNFWTSYLHRLDEAEDNVINLSFAMSRQAEDTFVPVEVAIDDMLREFAQTGMLDSSKVRSVLDTHRAVLPQLVGFYLFDERGNLVSSTAKGPLYIYNAGRREYFLWLKEHNTSALYISRVSTSSTTGRHIIPVAKRLTGENGEFKGIFLATIDHNYFGNFYRYFTLDYNSVLSLMNADAHAIFIYPDPASYINDDFTTGGLFDQQRQQLASGSGTWRTTLDNKVRIVGYVRLKRYPLVVAASVEKAAVQRRWLMENLPAMLLNVFVLFPILFMGALVLKQIRLTVRNKDVLTRLHQEETDKNRVLQKLALVDPLTRLANRRRFDSYLEQSLEKMRDEGKVLSLIMMDVDFFKYFNDTYGHVRGDRCLSQIGSVLLGRVWPSGALPARYGGEEFAVILPNVTGEQAELLGAQVVEAIRACAIPHQESLLPDHIVTVSVGVYSFSSANPCDVQRLKDGADQALYLAKKKGRNQCVRL
ncbi:diguanylate cyclase [Musicola paradisiaca Ech703]|uniref:diguanylate cyclase n=2 Tax=Musicola paradisiaca TaxID=69223 RepID=C6CCY4_MUSP7|nr:diguanylate cyclase [Musicola paradisiaca Ech703]